PDQPGTTVSARRGDPRYPVKALATIRGQALVTVAGKGMMGVPGIAARTFAAVHAAGLSVSTIFQASSESSIGFTLPAGESAAAVAALRRGFKEGLSAGLIDDVASRSDVAVIAVVGEGMAGTPGIAARVFGALAASGLNVIAVAQGSSERNISFVVRAHQAGAAAQRVHDAFQLAKIGGGRPQEAPHTDVVLLGFGRVGRALVGATLEAGGGPPPGGPGGVARRAARRAPGGPPRRVRLRVRPAGLLAPPAAPAGRGQGPRAAAGE